MAHKWAGWLHNPCGLGGPTASERGAESKVAQAGNVATWPLPPAGSPLLQRGAESEVTHKWARWLHKPCHLGGHHRFRAGGRIRGGPGVGKVAIESLPTGVSPPLHSGGQNQKWPTSGQGGYITPAAWGVPTASEREGLSTQTRKKKACVAAWLLRPCDPKWRFPTIFNC